MGEIDWDALLRWARGAKADEQRQAGLRRSRKKRPAEGDAEAEVGLSVALSAARTLRAREAYIERDVDDIIWYLVDALRSLGWEAPPAAGEQEEKEEQKRVAAGVGEGGDDDPAWETPLAGSQGYTALRVRGEPIPTLEEEVRGAPTWAYCPAVALLGMVASALEQARTLHDAHGYKDGFEKASEMTVMDLEEAMRALMERTPVSWWHEW